MAALGLRGYEKARKNCDDRDGDEDSHAPPRVPTRLRALHDAFGWSLSNRARRGTRRAFLARAAARVTRTTTRCLAWLHGSKGAYGIRTRAAAVRGRCPRPLDECAPDARQCSGFCRSLGTAVRSAGCPHGAVCWSSARCSRCPSRSSCSSSRGRRSTRHGRTSRRTSGSSCSRRSRASASASPSSARRDSAATRGSFWSRSRSSRPPASSASTRSRRPACCSRDRRRGSSSQTRSGSSSPACSRCSRRGAGAAAPRCG